MKVWIAAIAKMEELYVREWIEWHRGIGIDHIVIGDNNDSDYEYQLQPIIQDFINEGYVEIIDLRDKIDVQVKLYNMVWNRHKDKFDWCSFLDLDEFVYCPNYGNEIKKLLAETESRGYNALVFPWLNMTSNRKMHYEDKPVQQRFTEPLNDFKRVSAKYFLKSSPDIVSIGSRHCPKQVFCENGYKILDIDTTFENKSFYWFVNKHNKKRYTQMRLNSRHLEQGYVKHFPVKSAEEFLKYRIMRGCALSTINKPYERYTIEYFKNHQKRHDYKFVFEAKLMFKEHSKDVRIAKEKIYKKIYK